MICRSFLPGQSRLPGGAPLRHHGADSEPGGDYDGYAEHRFRTSISDALCDLGAEEV
jgi:hypothetical protein